MKHIFGSSLPTLIHLQKPALSESRIQHSLYDHLDGFSFERRGGEMFNDLEPGSKPVSLRSWHSRFRHWMNPWERDQERSPTCSLTLLLERTRTNQDETKSIWVYGTCHIHVLVCEEPQPRRVPACVNGLWLLGLSCQPIRPWRHRLRCQSCTLWRNKAGNSPNARRRLLFERWAPRTTSHRSHSVGVPLHRDRDTKFASGIGI